MGHDGLLRVGTDSGRWCPTSPRSPCYFDLGHTSSNSLFLITIISLLLFHLLLLSVLVHREEGGGRSIFCLFCLFVFLVILPFFCCCIFAFLSFCFYHKPLPLLPTPPNNVFMYRRETQANVLRGLQRFLGSCEDFGDNLGVGGALTIWF